MGEREFVAAGAESSSSGLEKTSLIQTGNSFIFGALYIRAVVKSDGRD
jgi:hypothetical protein